MANVFQEIKDRINILDYISKFVKLKNQSGKYVGLCPFHAEKTPSFYVDSAKNLFHCFGCHAGGDIFEFFMKYHNVPIQEALKDLANACGVTLISAKLHNEQTDLDKLSNFFQESLLHEIKLHEIKVNDTKLYDVKKILQMRGIKDQSVEKFKIGKALDSSIINQYIKNSALNLGQYGFNDYSWKMFEHRIIFPIFDNVGKICSLGGRIYRTNDKRAKYINGPASKYFAKSSVLYGLNFVKKFMPIYITEGYIDVILMQQHGLNAVAPLGTAFSKEQLMLLFEKSNEIIVAMDGDNSGKKSALNIAYLALELLDGEHHIKFIQLPEGEDPASFLAHSDLKSLKVYELYEYVFMQEYQNYSVANKKTPEKAVQIYKKLISLADKIKDKALKSEYRKRWKELWWNRDKLMRNFVALPERVHLPLLLFKYVFVYPDILSEVSEHFARLPLEKFFKIKQLKQEEADFYMQQVFNLLNFDWNVDYKVDHSANHQREHLTSINMDQTFSSKQVLETSALQDLAIQDLRLQDLRSQNGELKALQLDKIENDKIENDNPENEKPENEKLKNKKFKDEQFKDENLKSENLKSENLQDLSSQALNSNLLTQFNKNTLTSVKNDIANWEEPAVISSQIFEEAISQVLDDAFIKKINNLSINAVLGDVINNKEDALNAWYKVADTIEKIVNKEAAERINALENNFCQEEWDKFKNWLITKESSKESYKD